MVKILIVEDEVITYLDLKIRLEEIGHSVLNQASNLIEAVSMTINNDPDIVLMDISINGPDDGIVTAQIINRDLLKPIVFITGYIDLAVRRRVSVISESVILTKPLLTNDLIKAIGHLSDFPLAKSRSANNATSSISSDMLCHFLFISRPETAIHSYRMKRWTMIMASHLNFDDNQRQILADATLLHDIGKILIPRSILDKPDRLTDEEFAEVQKHTVYPENMLDELSNSLELKQLIRHHHEKWDGSGYPDGLNGVNIPIGARIIALADTFDVMTHDRPYKTSVSPSDAIYEICQCAGSHFDPGLVNLFTQCVSDLHTPIFY